jgi:hypothetical protein
MAADAQFSRVDTDRGSEFLVTPASAHATVANKDGLTVGGKHYPAAEIVDLTCRHPSDRGGGYPSRGDILAAIDH